jgi:hypothetical protein
VYAAAFASIRVSLVTSCDEEGRWREPGNAASNWTGGTIVSPNLGVRALATILALASLPTAGCSWLFVNKPPQQPIPASPPMECTASVASPVIDTVVAVALAAGGAAIIVVSTQNRSQHACTPSGTLGDCDLYTYGFAGGGLLMAAAIPTAISAGYGFSKTSDCRTLKEIQLACVSGVENSCAALRGKPAGEDCSADIECGGGNICFRGSCNPKPRGATK